MTPAVASAVKQLGAKYPKFGGVAAWEYFNALPGGLQNPVKLGAIMAKAMATETYSNVTRSFPFHRFWFTKCMGPGYTSASGP